jgi:hypothetical protein
MLVPRVVTVGYEWSSSLRLSVHIFFSQWPVLQLLTLLLSLHLLDSLVDTLPPLSLVSSLVDALLLRVVAGPPVDALPQWASSLLPRRMLGHRWNPWKMLCRRCLFGPFFGRCFDARSVLALSWWIYTWLLWSLGLHWRILCRWLLVYLFRMDTLPPQHCLLCRPPFVMMYLFFAGSIGRLRCRG